LYAGLHFLYYGFEVIVFFSVLRPGRFLLIFSLLVFSCSSTPLPSGVKGQADGLVNIPEDFFGMVHAGNSQTEGEYFLLDEMGVKWILKTFYWNSIERTKGTFYFSQYDDFVDAAQPQGKKIVAVLGYEAQWLYPEGKSKRYISKENIESFLKYVEETVKHFHERVDVWEIWNEPNLNFWEGSSGEFFELTKFAAGKIRDMDNEAYILGGVFWRAPKKFIKNMYRSGAMEYLDALAFHPYAINPSGSARVYDRFLKVLSEINYSQPVWITEVGYPTAGWYPTRVSLEEFPSHVVKTITGAAVRGARALLWYELLDSYNKGKAPPNAVDSEKFFGLVYPDYERKGGAWAYELCARFLPGSVYSPGFLSRENIPKHIVTFCFLSGTSGNNTLIIWNDSNYTQKLTLHLPSSALLYDISHGQSTSIQADAFIHVGKKPLVITWQGMGQPLLSK
jgi:hypothetical protein